MSDGELISVYDFAARYRVDVSIVRSWIKQGRIKAELVGPRKMLLKEDVPKLVRPIEPEDTRRDWNRRQLVSVMVKDGLDIDVARSIVAGMEPADVDKQLADQLMEGEHVTEERRSDNSQGPASAGESTDDSSAGGGDIEGAGQYQEPTGRTQTNPKGKGRGRRTLGRTSAPARRR